MKTKPHCFNNRYIDNASFKEALTLIGTLLRELKKLDDKMILTEVHLLESRVNHALSNLPKAKVSFLLFLEPLSRTNLFLITLPQAALTSARTAANSIYCPPLLQAQLDMQSGILHAEDKDYKTAFIFHFFSPFFPLLFKLTFQNPIFRYSYFFEALEGLSSQDDPKATAALKYMLLCKIMLNLVSSSSSSPFLAFRGKLTPPYRILSLKMLQPSLEEN